MRAGWGKQVVVTVAAAIAVEDKDDALDNEVEINDLNKYKYIALGFGK